MSAGSSRNRTRSRAYRRPRSWRRSPGFLGTASGSIRKIRGCAAIGPVRTEGDLPTIGASRGASRSSTWARTAGGQVADDDRRLVPGRRELAGLDVEHASATVPAIGDRTVRRSRRPGSCPPGLRPADHGLGHRQVMLPAPGPDQVQLGLRPGWPPRWPRPAPGLRHPTPVRSGPRSGSAGSLLLPTPVIPSRRRPVEGGLEPGHLFRAGHRA